MKTSEANAWVKKANLRIAREWVARYCTVQETYERGPYTFVKVAIPVLGGQPIVGIGFAKYNPGDAKAGLPMNGLGYEIARGRAIKDAARQIVEG